MAYSKREDGVLGFAAGTGEMRGGTALCSFGYSQRHLLLKTDFIT